MLKYFDENFEPFLVGLFTSFALLVLIAMFNSSPSKDQEFKADAVRSGNAYYTIDEYGKTKFQWKQQNTCVIKEVK